MFECISEEQDQFYTVNCNFQQPVFMYLQFNLYIYPDALENMNIIECIYESVS